jgi:hypothetical protein
MFLTVDPTCLFNTILYLPLHSCLHTHAIHSLHWPNTCLCCTWHVITCSCPVSMSPMENYSVWSSCSNRFWVVGWPHKRHSYTERKSPRSGHTWDPHGFLFVWLYLDGYIVKLEYGHTLHNSLFFFMLVHSLKQIYF